MRGTRLAVYFCFVLADSSAWEKTHGQKGGGELVSLRTLVPDPLFDYWMTFLTNTTTMMPIT